MGRGDRHPGDTRRKRDDQRRNRVTKPADEIYVDAEPFAQPPPREDWSDSVKEWYVSLSESGQAAYYEASDWAQAMIAGDILQTWYELPKGRGAELMKTWEGICTKLMVTEGDRRRARLEVHRKKADEGPDQGEAAVIDMKKKLGVVS